MCRAPKKTKKEEDEVHSHDDVEQENMDLSESEYEEDNPVETRGRKEMELDSYRTHVDSANEKNDE